MAEKLSKKYHFKTEKCDAEIRFLKTRYVNNGSLAIVMFIESDYSNDLEEIYEPYAVLTVNLIDSPNENYQFIDVNNLGEMALDWLARKGIATYQDYDLSSGFCIYPLAKFSDEFVDNLEYVTLDGSYVSIPKKSKVVAK